MMIKKMTTSSGEGIMIVAGAEDSTKFPVGFEYVLGSVLYKVTAIVTKDAHAEMRKLSSSDGSEEIVTLDTIERDLKSHDCHVVNNAKPVVVEEVKAKRGRPRKQK
jgi:hypothetical protein